MCLTKVRICLLWQNLRAKSKSYIAPPTKATKSSPSLWFLRFKEKAAPRSLFHKFQKARGQPVVPIKLDFNGLSISESGA